MAIAIEAKSGNEVVVSSASTMGIKTVVEEEGGQEEEEGEEEEEEDGQEEEKGEEEEEGGQVIEVPYAQQPFYYFCLTHCLGLGFPQNCCGRRGWSRRRRGWRRRRKRGFN